MVEIMRMPGVLAGAESGIIHSWSVAEGDPLTVGQVIAEVETEKATVEITADVAGSVGRLLAATGDEIDVGAPIMAILGEGDTAADIDAALPSAAGAAPEPSASVPAAAPAAAPAQEGGERIFASPLVRRLAREKGVDVQLLEGTGHGGRIVRRDLERYLETHAQQPVAPAAVEAVPVEPTGGYVDIPLSPMRKAIARRLTESKSTVPHFYLTADCRMDDLLALREQINTTSPKRISVNDFVLKAVAVAHREVPEANSIWNGDSIRRFDSVDIAMAVAIDDGLITPVIRDVDSISITALSNVAADLVERSRSGGLKQHELEGGTFTVSNLGMYGTKEFSAILNPPQAGILAVGAALPIPVVTDGGEVAVRKVMTVTLSADHRVLDGAIGAAWLAAFQKAIENPLGILL